MRNRQAFLKIALFVLLVLVIKIAIALQFSGPQVIPDESCVILKAKALISMGELLSCNNLFGRLTGNPFPLYSIVIAPLYIFLKGLSFYYAILILNAFLVTSLIFPLKKILENTFENKKNILIIIFIVLFAPQILIFGNLGMTETLFTVLNIWGLYFYINSFYVNKTRNKIISIIFAILAAFTRPFGFVVLMAIAVNEFVINKRKKLFGLIAIMLVIFISLSINSFLPSIFPTLLTKIESLNTAEHLIYLVKAFVNQTMSMVWATYLVPLVLFIYQIFTSKNEGFKKIRFYLIFLNLSIFLLSFQHLYGYFIEGLPASISTRYINLPITFTILFGLHCLNEKEKFKLNVKSLLIISVFVLLMIFTPKVDFSNGITLIFSNYLFTSKIIGYFLIIATILVAGLVLNKKRAVLISLTMLFFTQSALTTYGLYVDSAMGNKKLMLPY